MKANIHKNKSFKIFISNKSGYISILKYIIGLIIYFISIYFINGLYFSLFVKLALLAGLILTIKKLWQ